MPIKGTRGIGYVLRKGLDLPRLMFTADEVDAIAVGARMVRRLRDPGLQKAANRVLAKVTTALPGALRSGLLEAPLEKPRLPISRSAVRSELRTEHGCAAHRARSSPPSPPPASSSTGKEADISMLLKADVLTLRVQYGAA
jgi:hypothetical protein